MSTPWTVLLYMAADNSLSVPPTAGGSSLVDDQFAAMQAATLDANVSVIVELVTTGGVMTRWRIAHGGKTRLDEQPQKVIVNTGTAKPLTEFIDWGIAQGAPNANVALVTWSHGSGVIDWGRQTTEEAATKPSPVFGLRAGPRARSPGKPGDGKTRAINLSDTYKSYLTTADFAQALADSKYCQNGNKFGVVVFDACYMAMVEVSYQIRGSAQYIVASENELDAPGLPYATFLSSLNSTVDPKSFAGSLVNAFGALKRSNSTAIAVDLSKLSDFADTLKSLADVMSARAADVLAARLKSPDIYLCFIDIRKMLGTLQGVLPAEATAPSLDALEIATVATVASGPGVTGYGGLAIYLPKSKGLLNFLSEYQALDFPKETGWSALLETLLVSAPQ
jgi:hypothetical protein